MSTQEEYMSKMTLWYETLSLSLQLAMNTIVVDIHVLRRRLEANTLRFTIHTTVQRLLDEVRHCFYRKVMLERHPVTSMFSNSCISHTHLSAVLQQL